MVFGVACCFLGAVIGVGGFLDAAGVIGPGSPPLRSTALAVVLLVLIVGVTVTTWTALAIVWFNRPRFLVPPHLRDEPGTLSNRRRNPSARQDAGGAAADRTPLRGRPVAGSTTASRAAGSGDVNDRASGAGTLRVTRDPTPVRDKFRAYTLLVDDSPVATIRRGASVSVELAPGPHTVRLKIDWCASPEAVVTVAAGTEHRLECGPRTGAAGHASLITAERDTYLWLRPAGDQVPSGGSFER
ncbi:hypothetical protein KCH_05450 [Kitasatospora cheerisanensis KCTC 2395]|uniref:Uncharacterized protein n=1 Tax=Kitasatospora cheerisanensis KCTC 2395 TaxID=1348663 RepID=A0A066ZC59_9ACTN|nr:hypothetical protein KCH_05450 [Kitasatospora cheerisanensis KCTC 2395]